MQERMISFESSAQAGLPRARARFLAQSIKLEEPNLSGIVSGAVMISVFLLISALAWAHVTPVSEVTAARGEVVPAGHTHKVQHLEGGIVESIHVRNGDRVKADELLLRLSPVATISELNQLRARLASLRMESARLGSVLSGSAPNFADLAAEYPRIAAKQLAIFRAQTESHESRVRVAEALVERRKNELTRQTNHAGSLKREVVLLREQEDMRNDLKHKGMVSRAEVLAMAIELAETESEFRELADGIAVAEDALAEARSSLVELRARLRSDVHEQLGEIEQESAEVELALMSASDRARRLEVRAPVSGIAKGVSINSVNSILGPGEVIVEIVPIEEDLVVEARISPSEIGHVRIGQEADVKVDSYEPGRYGTVRGDLRRISPSTYVNEQGEPYYRAEIALEKDHIGAPENGLRILPGMTVQADIITGKKTILEYLIRPVSRGFSESFRER